MTLTINFKFRKQMQALNFSFNYCFQCSTCSGACSVAKFTNGDFNPRKIIESAILGLKDNLINKQKPNIWLCSTCQKCVDLCPQGVELTEVFDFLKNYFVQQGKIPEAYKSQGISVYENGLAMPIGEAILKRRSKLGLPQIKTAKPKEIQKLLEKLEFDKLIQYKKNEEEK